MCLIRKGLVIIIIFLIAFVVLQVLQIEKIPGYISGLLSPGQQVERLKHYETGQIKEVYLVKDNGNQQGFIQKVNCPGYNGSIEILVKINFPEKKLSEIRLLNHNETPNYGGYIEEGWFLERFVGKKAEQELVLVKLSQQSAEEVVAITGATITSQGVLTGVNQAFKNFNNFLLDRL